MKPAGDTTLRPHLALVAVHPPAPLAPAARPAHRNPSPPLRDEVFGRRSHHYQAAPAAAALSGLDFRTVLGAAQSQSKVKWMSDGADIVGARKAELEDDLDAAYHR